MQPTYMYSVLFWGKFTSGSRISASRSDLLKLPSFMTSPSSHYKIYPAFAGSTKHMSGFQISPFRSEIDKTTSRKQTRSSYERKEIKTLVIFRTLFAQVSADSIRTHACSRIKYIVYYYSEQLIANVTPCFLQAVQFSFGLLCMVRGFARS